MEDNMPAALSYPGVYIEEVSSGVHAITGVATSIAAFIGRTRWGPDNEPVVINSFADFERRFGGLWLSSPMSFAVRDFYLNGGSQAVIVRVFAPSLASAAAEAEAAANAVAVAADGAVTGAAGAPAVAAAAQTRADSFTDGTAAAAAADAVAKAAHDFAAISANAAKKAETAAEAHAAITGAVSAAAAAAADDTVARLDLGALKLMAASPGTWANDLQARIDIPPGGGGMFNLAVRDDSTQVIEQFNNLSLTTPLQRRVDNVLQRESTLVRLDGAPPTGPLTPTSPAVSGKQWWQDASSRVTVANTAQGSDGDEPTDAIVEGSASAKTGLYALDKAEEFNLLCIPPHKLTEDGDIGGGLIDAAIAYCVRRRAFFLIDPPSGWKTKDAARSGVDGPSIGTPSANAALYFPRILRPNPLSETAELTAFVPCGAVAGLYARTDTQRGVWKAPAGLDAALVDAPQLSVPLNDPENGELNPKGINCLRAMAGAGRVIWGARTRFGADARASEWKYVPVRRTALFIEESLYRGTQWVVFEPNDEPLWASIRLNVGAFMQRMFRQGAFQGSSPREAYFVKCDKDTTTQADIDLGIVNILVGFAPLKPAEFVVIKLQQIAGNIPT
ncbi:MAG: phage tail sheath family protein [Allosphingosinicella sp.]